MILPGDILAWRVDPKAPVIDRLIGWGESKIGQVAPKDAQYYHVAFIAANPKYFYSSQPPYINKFLLPDIMPFNVETYRTKMTLQPEGLANVFQYAESRRGRLYPFMGVLTLGWLQGNLEFCSQLVEDSFAHYPLLLCPDIRFTTPDDIVNSLLLERVQ